MVPYTEPLLQVLFSKKIGKKPLLKGNSNFGSDKKKSTNRISDFSSHELLVFLISLFVHLNPMIQKLKSQRLDLFPLLFCNNIDLERHKKRKMKERRKN
jgi:hypothetical protein